MYSAIISSGYIPRTATEIAARLQVPSPKLLLQVRKFRQQMIGCFTLQPLQQSPDRYLRWNRKEQMHMILRYVPLHYLHFVLPANVTDQVAHSHRYISRQRRPSVLRDPHQMQMYLKYRVRAPFGIPASPQLTGGALAEAVACKARASTRPDSDSEHA